MSNVHAADDVELEAGQVLEVAEVENEEVELSDADKALVERARRMGWRPKEQYSGDPARWVDFREFVDRGDNELPILRERFRKLDTRLGSTESELRETKERLKESTEVLVELRDMSRTAEQRGYMQAVHELRQRELKAVAEADTEAFVQIAAEKEALERTRPAPPPAAPPRQEAAPPPPPPPQGAMNPEIQQWVEANKWFSTDPVLNAYAMAEDRDVELTHPDWPMRDKLAEVKRRTVAKFPERFDNPRRQAAPSVATSSAPITPRPKGKTVKDLPPDAKVALERFKRTIPGFKEEEYLRMYFQGE